MNDERCQWRRAGRETSIVARCALPEGHAGACCYLVRVDPNDPLAGMVDALPEDWGLPALLEAWAQRNFKDRPDPPRCDGH